METSERRGEAIQEYYFLQGDVARFDHIAHGVKNWSITISFAIIGFSVVNDVSYLSLLASVVAIIFWSMEARWKRYQRIHFRRISALEKILGNVNLQYQGPEIRQNFLNEVRTLQGGKKEEIRMMLLGNVSLPHLAILILSILSFFILEFIN